MGLRAELADGLPRRRAAQRGDGADGGLPAGNAAHLRQFGLRPGGLDAGLAPGVRMINPVTDVTDAVRGLLAGGPVGRPLLESAAWITGITAVSWTLTLQRYRARG